jgi:chromosome segregation ATPase
MTFIAINFTLVEILVLLIVAIIFGVTVFFFLKSRKSLQETLRATKRSSLPAETRKEKQSSHKRTNLVELEEQFARMRYETSFPKEEKIEPPTRKLTHKEEIAVQDLKNTISQQQKMLDSYLQKVEELEHEGREELNSKIEELEKKVDELIGVIEGKDEEIKELHQQVSAGERMAARIDEVYQEFEQLQTKMVSLEKQASRANNLAIELEDAKYSYEQVHKELLRKQEKLEELMSENQRIRQQMDELEDKLSEANLQRQQLQKKVLFLTDLNSDMQSISDTNKKLQTELRRIGELESMLNMMAEERDFLLRKKMDK